MTSPPIPYGRHHIDEADIAAVVEVLRGDWLTTGPWVEEFEEAFASRVGAQHAVSFSSGTAALHASAHVAGIGPGDEAVTTPLTFCATANCVLYCGGTPVFADVSPGTLNIDPEQVVTNISPRTKAIIAVDYAGHPADLSALRALADRYGLLLIEDACHAAGATYRDAPVGSISDMTIFSFHPVKHITTGEGGMVTTDDPELASRLRRFRNHGIDRDARQRLDAGVWAYDVVELGWNYRLSDIACALGTSQLQKLEGFLAARRQLAWRYQEALSEVSGLILPSEQEDVRTAWHLYPVQIDPETALRDRVFSELRESGIGVAVHYPPVHLLRIYRERFGYTEGALPVAEAACRRLLTLPIYPEMAASDQEAVVCALRRALAVSPPQGQRNIQ